LFRIKQAGFYPLINTYPLTLFEYRVHSKSKQMKKVVIGMCFHLCFCLGYSQSGILDPSFGTRGIVSTDLGLPMVVNSVAAKVLLQADGSFYLLTQSGELAILIKKHADGSTDLSYGVDGYSAAIPVYGRAAALQADGKIVIVGSNRTIGQTSYNGSDFTLARVNTDGSLDQAFNRNGILTGDFGGEDGAGLISIQEDGKLLVVVFSTNGEDSYIPSYELLRYNEDGSPDAGFKAVIDHNISVSSMAILPGGKILLAGDSLQRFNSDLTLDSSFNGSGSLSTPVYASAIAAQQDGKIMVTGPEFDENDLIKGFGTVRYNSDGSLDSSFADKGFQRTGYGWSNGSPTILVQPDGKIVFSGSADDNGMAAFAINRYNPNGQVDSSFSQDGQLTTNLGSNAYIVSSQVQADGKIVLAGYTTDGASTTAVTVRYDNMGIADVSFDSDGILYDVISRGATFFSSTAVQPDGKLVAAGYAWNGSNYDFAIVRYNTNGSLDLTFSGDGKQLTDLDALDDKINAIAIQADGKILVAGSAGDNFAICRYNTDGSLDPGFDLDGWLITDFGSTESIAALSIQADGKILAGGSLVARYNPDGSRDMGFGEAGQITLDCSAIALQKDGKIVLTGARDEVIRVYRYDANGLTDSTYGEYGVRVVFPTSDFSYMNVKSIVLQEDGKLLIAGYHEYLYRYSSYSFIAMRLNEDGTTDGTFNNGQMIFSFIDGYSHALSAAIQPSGQILLGGFSYDGSSDNFTIAGYNIDGSANNSFNGSGVVITHASPGNDRIAAIRVANDKLYAGGSGQFNHGNRGVVARYLLDPEGGPVPNFVSRANGNWNDPNTWIGGIVPAATAVVIIQHAVTITANASCYSLWVQPPAGSLMVSTGVHLTISH
jgi:uncharacterized delta-60 repeat protein